jgi:hypothetical protein
VENIVADVRGRITSDGGESTSAIRRKYLDEVRMCQDGAMDADIANLPFAATLSLYNTITKFNIRIVCIFVQHSELFQFCFSRRVLT